MRTALSALILSALVWVSSVGAQTRGISDSTSSSASKTAAPTSQSSGSRSTASHGRSNPTSASTTAPIHQAIVPRDADRDRSKHERHPGRENRHHQGDHDWYGGYIYPYPVNYGEQPAEPENQQSSAERLRVEQERQDDLRRERELERQLADQRAADAAAASVDRMRIGSPTPAEHDSTVLIYKDHHRIDLQDYAVVGDKIYVFSSQETRKIALSDVDIPATIEANKERGVEFNLPESSPARTRQEQ